MTNLVFFVAIYSWLHDKIKTFGFNLMSEMMKVVSAAALVLITCWIMVVGYRAISGTLREPLMAVVIKMARIAVIVTIATTMSINSTDLFSYVTTDLNQEINQLVTGNDTTVQKVIDKNLAYTEVAMSAIDAVQIVSTDAQGNSDKNRATLLAGLGTAGPPITAAVMLLMYEFALALFIGLGPLFIMCLIFDSTKSLFQRWLLYGIGTLFSMAVLSAVVAMVLQLTAGVAATMWTEALVNKIFKTNVEGITQQSMEQGGLGLILTMLIVTIPPMAANFFQGTLGNFLAFSQFGGAHVDSQGRNAMLGDGGRPPGQYQRHDSPKIDSSTNTYVPRLFGGNTQATSDTGISRNPQFAQAPTAPPSSYT